MQEVSTSRQKNNLQNQIDSIKEFISVNGIAVDEVYSDIDIASGINLDRKRFLPVIRRYWR